MHSVQVRVKQVAYACYATCGACTVAQVFQGSWQGRAPHGRPVCHADAAAPPLLLCAHPQMQVTREHGPPVYESGSSRHSISEGSSRQQEQEATEAAGSGNHSQAAAVAVEGAAGELLHGSWPDAHAGTAPSSSSTDSSGCTRAAAAGRAAAEVHSSGSTDQLVQRQLSGAAVQSSKSSHEIIKAMSVEDILRHWKLFLREFSDELVHVQQAAAAAREQQQQQLLLGSSAAATAGDGQSEPTSSGGFSKISEQRLQEVTTQARYLLGMAATLNPGESWSCFALVLSCWHGVSAFSSVSHTLSSFYM